MPDKDCRLLDSRGTVQNHRIMHNILNVLLFLMSTKSELHLENENDPKLSTPMCTWSYVKVIYKTRETSRSLDKNILPWLSAAWSPSIPPVSIYLRQSCSCGSHRSSLSTSLLGKEKLLPEGLHHMIQFLAAVAPTAESDFNTLLFQCIYSHDTSIKSVSLLKNWIHHKRPLHWIYFKRLKHWASVSFLWAKDQQKIYIWTLACSFIIIWFPNFPSSGAILPGVIN